MEWVGGGRRVAGCGVKVINDLKKYGYKKDNCELNYKFLNNLQPEWKQYGDVNDALGYKKKVVMVTSDPLSLVAEKINSANKKQEFVKTNDKKVEKKADEKKRDLSKVKCYNCKKEGHFAKDCKKAKVKDYNYYKSKMLLAKKDSDEQVLLAEDQAWMESSSNSNQEINANMVFMAQIKKVLSESDESSSSAEETIADVAYYTSESESESEFETSGYYDNSTNYGLFVNNDDDQEIFHDAIEFASENFIENHIDSQKEYDKSEVDHNDSEEKENLVDKLIQKFNHKIAKCQKRIEKANQQMLIEKNDDLLAQTKVLQDQLQVKHVVIDTHVECHEKYAKLEAERYEYMIRYSALFDHDKQHRKQIADQEVLFDKISVELVELDKHVRDLKNTALQKVFKFFELEECVCNKDLEIEKCLECLNVCENKLHKMGQTNQTVHMIMPSKDTLYNGRKGLGFENPSYFEKAKDLRPTLYDEKVIGLRYTLMFLTHSNEALEIEKFKRSRENKIEFAYDYGNLNASYVNEKINFEDDYFQEIINLDFDKIDSPFQQTSSLKPYVPNLILEKIIIDLEDEVVSLLEKEKANLETIESLKSKGFKSSENVISESENQSENDCLVVEKECDKEENPKIIQICLWIIDSGCSKHMTGNRALLMNFVEKFLRTVRFGNNDFAVIAGYGDVVIDGVDLLTGDRSSNFYNISLNEVASNSSSCLLPKASSSQSWMWHQRLSHLNFTTINNLVKNNLVQVQRVRTDNGTEFKNKTLSKFFDEVGITQQFSAARTPQQNGVVERRNRTLVEAARTMLTFENLPSFLWAEDIATACFTQNSSIIRKRFDKTPYELMNKRKPNIKFFRVFGCRCYLLNDYEDVGKLKANGDIRVFVGYSKDSAAFRIYNKQTRKIHESVNVNFDEISEMASKQFSLEPGLTNLNETG
nr:retrovirus-related Pol polyprotein from transposon TNT 1-94 [Tanacetum cinerariifolium]